jgi:DNA-directed RNA polymerase alpha subunit
MTDTKKIAEILYEAVNEHGLLSTLYSVFGPRINFSLPLTAKSCDTSLDDMEFSVRASNALKRAGMFQIRQIVDVINQGELPRIRNLGKKTENEIGTRLLVFGYCNLTATEQKAFLQDLVERNLI